MLSDKLLAELNTQIKHELYSSHLYLAMAGYCHAEDLNGFANFFRVQAEEERFHAMKFYDFVKDLGGRLHLADLGYPENEFSSIVEVFEKTLAHEKFITSRIYELMDLAMADREHATMSFLKWFVDEQVQEEAMMSGHLKRLQRIGNDSHALYTMDAELALRVFTPPPANQVG